MHTLLLPQQQGPPDYAFRHTPPGVSRNHALTQGSLLKRRPETKEREEPGVLVASYKVNDL